MSAVGFTLVKEHGAFPGAQRGLYRLRKRKMTIQHLSFSTSCWTK